MFSLARHCIYPLLSTSSTQEMSQNDCLDDWVESIDTKILPLILNDILSINFPLLGLKHTLVYYIL